MKLVNLTIAGFKSFADRTKIKMDQGQIGVVGPNGCGKSNIVDALRWVMGEIRASQLRQGTSSDVIFSGAGSRKPADWCSVEIQLQNDGSHELGMWGGFSEITVRRQLERGGESHYFINGQRTRRRDVADLFAGTGTGSRAYGIVEQEQVNQLVKAEPDRLRMHLEEAAGVATYKARRRETERRLASSEANLKQLEDRHRLVRQQIEKLQRQAKQTVRARDLKNQLHVAKALGCLLQLEKIEEEAKQLTATIEHNEAIVAKSRGEISKVQQQVHAARNQREQANKDLTAVLSVHYQLSSELEMARNRQQEVKEAIDQEERELKEASYLQEVSIKRQEDLAAEIIKLEADIRQHTKLAEEAEQKLAGSEDGLTNAQRLLEQQRHQLEQLRVDRDKASVILHEANSLVELTSQRIEDLANTKSNAERELASLPAVEEFDKKLLAQAEQLVAKVSAKEQASAKVLNELSFELQVQKEQMVRLQSKAGSLQAELDLLRKVSKQAVTKNADWFTKQAQQQSERLIKLAKLRAPRIEAALDAALGHLSEGLVVNSIDQTLGEHGVPEGIALVKQIAIDFKSDKQTPPLGTTPLIDSIKVNAEWSATINHWLRNFFLAADSIVARKAAQELKTEQLIVTPDGELWGHGFVIGPQHLAAGLEWIASLERAETELVEVEQSIVAKQAKLQEIKVARDGQEKAHTVVIQELQDVQVAQTKVEQERDRLQHETTYLNERKNNLNNQLALIKESHSKRQAESEVASQTQQQRQIEKQKFDDLLSSKLTTIEKHTEQYEQVREERRGVESILRGEVQLAEHARQRIADLRSHLQEQQQLAVTSAKKVEQVTARLAKRDIASLEQQVKDAQLLVRDSERKKQQAQQASDLAKDGEVTVEQKLIQTRHDGEQAQAKLYECQISGAKLQAAVDAANSQFKEFACEEEKIERLREAFPKLDELEKQIKKISRSIDNIGPINYAADAELVACEQSITEVEGQRNDLATAVEILRVAIERIDNEMLKRLQDVYSKLNKRFDELFKKLFDGGEAELVLNGDSLLDAGLNLKACPPGKRVSSIQSLSGGEKTLTALAFLFALNDLNPPPFCILDEVDAALDDANTRRYCQLLNQMRDRSQFIVITHNKVVVDSVDRLIGVTQQEKGVSKIVTVNTEQAVETARGVAEQ